MDESGQDSGVVREMATPRKKWPHECEYARMDSIAAARKALRLVDEIIEGMDYVPKQFVYLKDELHKIESKLMAVGSNNSNQ